MLGIVKKMKEAFRYVRDVERLATERAEARPHLVNRDVLILLPRQRYFDWLDLEGSPKFTAEFDNDADRRWGYARAYLVPTVADSESLQALIDLHGEYFVDEFLRHCPPRLPQPVKPGVDDFCEWFEPRLVGWGTWDLDDSELTKSPDIEIRAVLGQRDSNINDVK